MHFEVLLTIFIYVPERRRIRSEMVELDEESLEIHVSAIRGRVGRTGIHGLPGGGTGTVIY